MSNFLNKFNKKVQIVQKVQLVWKEMRKSEKKKENIAKKFAELFKRNKKLYLIQFNAFRLA